MTTYGERNCDCCGNVYTAKRVNQRYCCVECQHKANRILKSDPNESYAKEFVRKYADGWEYVGEYTGSEGSMIIRHKACGSTIKRSCVAIRHNKIRCNECYKAERERERSRRDEANKYRKIHSKTFKYQITEIKECAVCGALFFSTKREKYCSDQCAKKVANRHSTDKKEKKIWEGLGIPYGEELLHRRGIKPVPVGDGYMPIAKLVQKLKDQGYQGYLAIEHFGAPDQLGYMLKSAEYLRDLLEE